MLRGPATNVQRYVMLTTEFHAFICALFCGAAKSCVTYCIYSTIKRDFYLSINYGIYLAVRQGFPLSRMTTNS